MSQYPNLIQRLFDTPLMILESKLQTILTVLAPRAEFSVQMPGSLDVPKRDTLEASLAGMGHSVRRSRNGYLMVGSTAVLDVMGTLVQRCSGMEAASGLVSYEFLAADVARMRADDEVSSVLMVLDTPGGEATSGLFDLAGQIAALRSEKPVFAYAHDLAASAGYLMASAANEVWIPETGAVGSIGVVTAHIDVSKKAEKDGVAVTYIYAGRHKIDGNPFEPLPDRVKARVQERVDAVYGMFVSRVAEYRGMSENDVIDTEADVYYGEDAVTMGLADGVASFDRLLSKILVSDEAFPAGSGHTTQHHEVKSMSQTDTPNTTPAPEVLTADQIADRYPDPAVALIDRGARAERERIGAILQHEYAAGRHQLAEHLAFRTTLGVEEAAGMLAASPKEAAEALSGQSPFETAMAALDNPDIGADGEPSGEMTPQAMAKSVVAMARKAGVIQ